MTADEVAERLATPTELAALLAQLETSDVSSSWGPAGVAA